MSDEEQRAVREGLDDEELAIFDLLTKPEPKLTKAQEVEVKAIARRLLAKLKHEKLILDWRLKENAKADIRQSGYTSDHPRGIRRSSRGLRRSSRGLRPAAVGGKG